MSWTFNQIAGIYNARDTDAEIMRYGVPALSVSNMSVQQARKTLRQAINTCREGPVLDALVCAMIAKPTCVDEYLKCQLSAADAGKTATIPADWVPAATVLAELGALGMKDSVIEESRAVFVLFFYEVGIRCANFGALFFAWVESTWNMAQAHEGMYLQLLRRNGEFGSLFTEPA